MKEDSSFPKKAVALRYDANDPLSAPRVVAEGAGETAERIEALALEHGVPLYQDEGLVKALSQIPVGEEIPEALYVAVAEVLAFVYWLSDKRPPDHNDAAELDIESSPDYP